MLGSFLAPPKSSKEDVRYLGNHPKPFYPGIKCRGMKWPVRVGVFMDGFVAAKEAADAARGVNGVSMGRQWGVNGEEKSIS